MIIVIQATAEVYTNMLYYVCSHSKTKLEAGTSHSNETSHLHCDANNDCVHVNKIMHIILYLSISLILFSLSR